ncbi:AfsR/SARP family transcriptional regulator [Pseudarthrobacter enclensis]|uniref:AfsR/SARP family transcriptional regulator n=1 Tax=Pseudarthrobacter enclensis TaxID=993070 RepID=UPI003EE38D8C
MVGNSPEVSGSISVRLFGTFEIRRDGVPLVTAGMAGCKPRHILEILLLNLGKPVSKDRIIETVWRSAAGGGTVATLESYVSGIRRAIQPGNTKSGPLRTANGGYVLDPALVDLDLARFRTLVAAAGQAGPSEAYPLLTEALELSAEPLLGSELASDWADEARAQLAAERLAALTRAAEAAVRTGRSLDAIRWASTAVSSDPLNERAWTLLVQAYESGGLVGEGLAAYSRCRSVFDRDLGCNPGPALQEAHLRLLHQQAAGNAELSEVMAALCVLDGSMNGPSAAGPGEPGAVRTREEAGRIVAEFLRRAQVAV